MSRNRIKKFKMKQVNYIIFMIIGFFFSCEPDDVATVKEYDWKDISIEAIDIDWQSIQMLDENNGFIGGYPKTHFELNYSLDMQTISSDTVIYNLEHTYSENGSVP